MCAVVVRVRREPWKVHREGEEESRSASGGGIGQTDLVEEAEWLDDEDEEDKVRVRL